jgi:hypothetical protein
MSLLQDEQSDDVTSLFKHERRVAGSFYCDWFIVHCSGSEKLTAGNLFVRTVQLLGLYICNDCTFVRTVHL